MPKTHELKIWPGPFADVVEGRKRFEWRKDDRGFEVGDTLLLREWGLDGKVPHWFVGYTGKTCEVKVLHIVRGMYTPPKWGIPRDYCIMSIELAAKRDIKLDAAVRKLKAKKPRLPLRRRK